MESIRNFSIIAHVDHGKSTLADRLMELCGAIDKNKSKAQALDSMELERERGITIKSQTVRLSWRDETDKEWIFNLLDTPGHVDFSYEVSRALAACESVLLLVDACQGVEAQTLAHLWKAVEHDHVIIPVFNKIDLPAADVERVTAELEETSGLRSEHALTISAKTGEGVAAIAPLLVTHMPPPQGDPHAPLQALVVDSWYDSYLGAVALVRIKAGVLQRHHRVRFMASQAEAEVEKLGFFTPRKQEANQLQCGEIGFLVTGIKNIALMRVGDTVTSVKKPASQPLAGFKPLRQVVFCGMFPHDADDYDHLKEALGRLSLNDASFSWQAEHSAALGHGFRCGFLGLLHLEIIAERLRREFNLEIITTPPSVIYHVIGKDGRHQPLHNPSAMPDISAIAHIEEPWIEATIVVSQDHIGGVLDLCASRRGEQIRLSWSGKRAIAVWRLPLAEVVYDFHDQLKSVSRGFASFDYEMTGFATADIVVVSILLNGERVDALSFMSHRQYAERRGRKMCERLKAIIPRQLFAVPIQAAIGGRIIARETLSAMRKDVTAKCYGGDITRKRKLLEKQKAGKKRMKRFGSIDLPSEAFFAVLKDDK